MLIMNSNHPYKQVTSLDQWRRCAHINTVVYDDPDMLALAAVEKDEATNLLEPKCIPGGLAFDPWCRLYHGLHEKGEIERLHWKSLDATRTVDGGFSATVLFSSGDIQPENIDEGGFVEAQTGTPFIKNPSGLAVDIVGRLFIADKSRSEIIIYDLFENRLLKRLSLCDIYYKVIPEQGTFSDNGESGEVQQLNAIPLDLASHGRTVYIALENLPIILSMTATASLKFHALPEGVDNASRVTVSADGAVFLLSDPLTENARVVPLDYPELAFNTPFASDIEFEDEDILVVAGRPGENFSRYDVSGMNWQDKPMSVGQLRAKYYDGCGIVRTPDNRIGFWGEKGFRHAVPARTFYERRGRVTSYALDSGEFLTDWGRVYLDACIPDGADVRLHFITSDDLPERDILIRDQAVNNGSYPKLHRPDLSPEMPGTYGIPEFVDHNSHIPLEYRLYKRAYDNELAWDVDEEGKFETYECPVYAKPGRYLWIIIELTGNSLVTPQVCNLRVETSPHDLLSHLPQLYSREQETADFLKRYLALPEGVLISLDTQAVARHALIDPDSTPVDLLPWLSCFIGMTQDERWKEQARRQLIKEGMWLYKNKGTIRGLKRVIEIYLQATYPHTEVTIIEHFRVMELGGAIVGSDSPLTSNGIVGAGYRIGESIGGTEDGDGAVTPSASDSNTHAHRFSVIIPLTLNTEEMEVIHQILEQYRPAHTIYDICTVDAGMRMSLGLYLELNSVIGHTGGFLPMHIDGALVSRDTIIGSPSTGIYTGASRLDRDSRVGL